MLRLAFVFPGQGAQHPGMGKDLYDHFEEAARIFDRADEITGYKLSSLCFQGPAEELNQTEFAQPALLVAGLAAFEVLKKQGITPTVTAGLSLGEYTALVAAGYLSLEEALPLVQKRARLMQEAVPPGKGAMAAVIGLEEEIILQHCRQAEGIVNVANYNCPGQIVISGEAGPVKTVSLSLKEAGGRVMPLAVSVPSHSQLMYDAAIQLRPYLNSSNWKDGSIDVVSNVNARENQAASLPEILERQLYCPVLWEQSVRYMKQKVDYFIEVGPGTTLSSLIKKIDRGAVWGNVNDAQSFEKLAEKVKSI